MSAFVVEAETIDRIVTWIDGPLYRDSRYLYGEWAKAMGHEFTRDEQWGVEHIVYVPNLGSIIGQRLLAMNVAAVNARYDEHEGPDPYDSRMRPATKVQVLKSLQCLHYQCSEGDVPTWPLYKLLDETISYLAQAIVSGMPEYEKAAWA